MLSYIYKNKKLFSFSLSIFFQFFFVFIFLLALQQTHSWFMLIKINSLDKLKNIEWSLWDFLTRSGKSMNTWSNISRYIGYQDQEIPKLILGFFNSAETDSTLQTQNVDLINNFKHFNIYLQVMNGALWCVIFLGLVNIFLFANILWDSILEARNFNFYKLILVTIFNISGFWFAYEWENNSLHDSRNQWLTNFGIIKILFQLRHTKYNFNLNNSKPLLEIKNLRLSTKTGKFNKKASTQILKGIDLCIKKGSFNVIIGPNGSGKTSLIKTIINLHENFEGEVLWHGTNLKQINMTALARYVSYIPQYLNIENPISITDFLHFARYPYKNLITNSPTKDKQIVEKAIIEGGCENIKDKMIDEISGGQRQKILLTSVLVQEAEVIILDEPTTYLDINNQNLFLNNLKKLHRQGKTIIMILHDLQQSIKYANNLIIVQNGKIKTTGHPSKVITKELLREVFNIDCSISDNGDYLKISDIYAIQ